jgi:L-threonylcarbamoyladenylate synthase
LGPPVDEHSALDAIHPPVRLAANTRGIAKAARTVKRGGVIVYPTDTVYGLGCEPRRTAAVQRILDIKGRTSKPMPILATNVQVAMQLVVLGPVGRALARHFWPGPVTLVNRARIPDVPQALQGEHGTLAVRVPGLAFTRHLLRACGGILVGTSANRSGSPACRSADEVLKSLPFGYETILDGGMSPLGRESTVVDVSGIHPRILREGQISAARVLAAARARP